MPLTPLRQKGPLQTHAIVIPSQLRGMKYSREMELSCCLKTTREKNLVDRRLYPPKKAVEANAFGLEPMSKQLPDKSERKSSRNGKRGITQDQKTH